MLKAIFLVSLMTDVCQLQNKRTVVTEESIELERRAGTATAVKKGLNACCVQSKESANETCTPKFDTVVDKL